MVEIVKIREGVEFTPEAARSFMRAEADLGREIDVNSTYREVPQTIYPWSPARES